MCLRCFFSRVFAFSCWLWQRMCTRLNIIWGSLAHFVGSSHRWLCNYLYRPMRDLFQSYWTSGRHYRAALSSCAVENGRYRLGEVPLVEHDNEDRWFETHDSSGSCQVVALFDGHDGPRAVDRACEYFKNRLEGARSVTLEAIQELFVETDSKFFENITMYLKERQKLQNIIPQGMKSYQASQLYPHEVARLQELEPLISGGCTAVVAVVCGNKLYVANVGDSRAVVVYQTPNGTLQTLQLSTDHDVKNEDELKRLEKLGLDPEQLKRAGRLGPQENTRSIGDYNIKGGYKSVDVLSHASSPPGTAKPSVTSVDIDRSFLYLLVMSDGVYKSIEAAVDEAQTIGANQVLANMVHKYAQMQGAEFRSIAQSTLDEVVHLHEEAFQRSAQQDVKSPKATACRKRDDMTLIVSQITDTCR